MTFTSKPPDGPARRAVKIFNVILGNVLELRFGQEPGRSRDAGG